MPWNIVCVLCTQPCPTLCNRMDRSPPGSPVHEILQARILEWVAISFSALVYYSALKRNKIMTRRNLEGITHRGRSWQKRTNSGQSHIHEDPEETDL